jgi:hypothetical protein
MRHFGVVAAFVVLSWSAAAQQASAPARVFVVRTPAGAGLYHRADCPVIKANRTTAAALSLSDAKARRLQPHCLCWVGKDTTPPCSTSTVGATATGAAAAGKPASKPQSYVNVDGDAIPSPMKAPSPPKGATALCRDGTYSFSAHRRGTCSHHGGVAQWL